MSTATIARPETLTEWARRIAATAPPLSAEQRAKLAALLATAPTRRAAA